MTEINDVNAIIRQQNTQMHEKITELKVCYTNTINNDANTYKNKEHLS